MGIVLAFRGLAFGFHADSGFCIVKGIAVDRAGRLTVGTGFGTVHLTCAFVREMITGNTGGDDAQTVLADACRGMVGCVAVQALCAAMVILIDAGIIIKAFVARACTDDTLAILTVCILCALRIAFAAVQRVTFELIFRQTQWFCIGTAIYCAILACINTLSLTAASGFGGFLVRTNGPASSAVIGMIAMDVDADGLIIACTKGFFRILAR